MKTILKTDWTVKDICEGFMYDRSLDKGLNGLNGKLTIQPEYQRNYIYAERKKDTMVDSGMPGDDCGAVVSAHRL